VIHKNVRVILSLIRQQIIVIIIKTDLSPFPLSPFPFLPIKGAFKCSYAEVDGKNIDVCKTPIHAPGKKSKGGRMTVNRRNNTIVTLCGALRDESDDIMETVFEDGILVREYSWAEVKENSKIDISNYSEWGPAVEARSEELLNQYRSSEKYAKDVEIMKVADPEYKPPY
jgi:hypothetical protein